MTLDHPHAEASEAFDGIIGRNGRDHLLNMLVHLGEIYRGARFYPEGGRGVRERSVFGCRQ